MENTNKKKLIIGAAVILVILGGWLILGKDKVEAPVVEFSESIIGSWKSVEYPSLVREFKADGIVSDKFGKAETASGSWQLFDRGTAPSMPGVPFDEEAAYLRINLTGLETDNIYFEVVSVSETELHLIYLSANGDTMKFVRQ